MADLIITVPDPVVPRVQAAFGKRQRLKDGNGDPRDATAEEVRQVLVGIIERVVITVEGDEAAAAARDGVTPVGVS